MIIVISIWAIAANWFAFSKGFYRLPQQQPKKSPHITNSQLIWAFGIYLFLSYVLTRLLLVYLIQLFRKSDPTLSTLPIPAITALQFGIMTTLFLLLQWIFFRQDRVSLQKIWKDKTHVPSFSAFYDFGLGALTWFVSFPIVTVLGSLVDTLLKVLFNYKDYEQNAVKFVKTSLNDPSSLVFALLSVLIVAPLVEEFLFRGVLQTYFKKRLGPHAAILLSALCFALFHFSFGHGLGNVSLILSLLILGSFLGFLYQKQGSLWAPIGLHVAFNAVSALRIIIPTDIS